MTPAPSNVVSASDRAAQWEILRRAFALEDNERSRAARELHDRAAQSLTACQLLLAHLIRVEPAGRESAVAEMQRLMEDLAADLREAALTLRPVGEMDATFAVQLESFVRDWASAAKVSSAVHLPGLALKLPAIIAGTIYRVVQESLRNVAEHAQARGVSVIVERRSDLLALIVEDDGQGFDPAGVEAGRHGKGGIALMRERALLVGADLQIESSPGHGSAVHLRISLAWAEAGSADETRASAPAVTGATAAIGRNVAEAAADVAAGAGAEAKLREADRRKNEFLAVLGHELRNPLSAIKGGLALLQSDATRPATRAAVLPIVMQQVAHMERLIDDVLDLGRIERGRLQVRPEWINLGTIADQALAMLGGLSAARSVQIARDLPVEAIRLRADPVRLTQVLANLLTNAIKFSPPGSVIELSAQGAEGGVIIRVRDHGLGIEPELLPRIFDGFVRSKRAAALEGDGLGLGLAVSRQLVELHGGTIEARSAGENAGSEFVIRLPQEGPS